MTCLTEENFGGESPALAGNLRFLLGLTVMIFGLILGFFYGGQGHGLGFLLMFASPFIILTDKRKKFDVKNLTQLEFGARK